jgi:hypothetical protein
VSSGTTQRAPTRSVWSVLTSKIPSASSSARSYPSSSAPPNAQLDRQHTKLVVGFILMLWLGVAANAFATGALSKPHHRYQARIAWLLVLPPLLLWRDPVRSAPAKPT